MNFKSTFIFCAFKTWSSDLFELAVQNKFAATIMSTAITGGVIATEALLKQSWFGTTYLVLFLVLLTLTVNVWSGIKKNQMKASVFLAQSQRHDKRTKEYRLNIRKWKTHQFDMKKLYFVFFKVLSFLIYLLVVKAITNDHPEGGEWYIVALSIGTEALIRIPIFLFWYYEFKSIGENSTYIFGQKASIFTIVEKIIEPKLFKMYGNTTPTDGLNDEDPPMPPRS